MSMLDRFCDAKNTFEGKALAVFLSFVLVFSMVSIAAFADPAEDGGESDVPETQVDNAATETTTIEAPVSEPSPATGTAPADQSDVPETLSPSSKVESPTAELGVAVVGLEFSRAYLKYLDQTIALPTDSMNVPLNKELVFTAHADEGCEIDTVKAVSAGVETELEADEQTGEYKVPAEQVTSSLVLKLEAKEAAEDPVAQNPAAEPITDNTKLDADLDADDEAAPGSRTLSLEDRVQSLPDTTMNVFVGETARLKASWSGSYIDQHKWRLLDEADAAKISFTMPDPSKHGDWVDVTGLSEGTATLIHTYPLKNTAEYDYAEEKVTVMVTKAPGVSAELRPSLVNADAAYVYYRNASDLASASFVPVGGTVSIEDFASKAHNGYLVFFVKPASGYLLTGLTTYSAASPKKSDIYSVTGSLGALNKYPGIKELVERAKQEGYVACFGYSRSKSNLSKVDGEFSVTGVAPAFQVSATSNKNKDVKPGDSLTFSVAITPETVADGKELSVKGVSVTSLTINGTSYGLEVQSDGEGSYTGTIEYVATEADCQAGGVRLNVSAAVEYSYFLNTTDRNNTVGVVETSATTENSTSVICDIADKKSVMYQYNYRGADGIDKAQYPEQIRQAPAGRSYFESEPVSVEQKPLESGGNLNDPKNNGSWTFDGWYLNGQPVADSITMGTSSLLIYGTWTFHAYDKLVYEANGGVGEMSPQEGITGQWVDVGQSGFTREGYTFNGWNTEADGSGRFYQSGSKYALTSGEDVLYAQWKADADALRYAANGGSGAMSDTEGRVDQKVTVAANGFIRSGWRFVGWNTEADGTGAVYAEGSAYALTPGEDVLYAQWEVDFGDLGVQGFEEFYDGEVHAVSLTGIVPGDEIAYAVTRGDGAISADNAFVNVIDSAQVVVTVTRGGKQWTSKSVPATIKPVPVNIVVDNQSKSFNDPDPEFTGTVSDSLVNEGDLGTVAFGRAEADKGKENVGDAIALVASYAENPNYAVDVTEGALTIVESDALSVAATGYKGVYDGQSHGIKVSTNLPDDQVVIEYSTDGGSTWTKIAPLVQDVAARQMYLVRASAPGYAAKVIENPVALEVTPIPVMVTATNNGKSFGDSDPDFEYTMDAVSVAGETLVFQGALEREAGEGVGDYAIEQGTLALDDTNGSFKAANYEVTVVPGAFTIRQTTGSVKVEKVWDNPGTALENPDIQIQLYRDDEPYGEAVTLSSGMLEHVFANLPQGKPKNEAAGGSSSYRYTVAEAAIGGAPVSNGVASVIVPGIEGAVKYASTVDEADGGFVITNRRTSVIVELAASISDRTIARDESLAQTFAYRMGGKSYTLGAGDVAKVAVDPGTIGVSVQANQTAWTTTYAVNGTSSKPGVMANVAALADTRVSFDNERAPLRYYVHKMWFVGDGGQLPDSLAFAVYQSTNQGAPNGSGVQVYEGSLSDWEPANAAFQKLAACDDLFPFADLRGAKYHYNAKEELADNYREPQNGYTGWSAGDGSLDNDGVYSFTGQLHNYYAVTSVSGTKTWEDFGAEVTHDNAAEVQLVLERSSDSGRTWQKVDAAPVWDGDRYTFGGLEKYTTPPFADRYRVSELPIEGYYTVQDGFDFTNRAVRELSIVAGSRSWVYDGDAHSEDSYELTVDGGAPLSVGADGVYTFPNGDVLSVEVEGAVTNVADTASGNNKVASWTLVDASGNDISGAYRVTAQDGSLAIEPADLAVSAENVEVLYDGVEHSTVAAASADGATVRYFNETTGAYDLEQPPAFRDAGVYEVRFQAAHPNYTTAEGAATVTVKKRSVILKSDDADKTFDGVALTAESVAEEGDGFAPGEGASYRSFAALVDAGSIANDFVYELDAGTKADNYMVKTEPGTLTVHKAPLAVTVTGAQATARYDGVDHAAEGYEHDAGDKATIALKEGALARAAGRDAGTYSMGLAVDSFAVESRNYEVTLTVVDGKLVIDPAEALIVANDTGKRYGEDDPELTARVDGLAAGDEFNGSYTLTRAAGEQAGSYPITVTDAVSNDPNYTVRTAPGTFVIAPAEGATIVVLGGTKVYDGAPLESGGIMAMGLAQGDSAEAAVRGSQTDVGTSEAGVESYVIRNAEGQDVTANYAEVTVVPGTLTVSPASVTIVVADAAKAAGADDPVFTGAVSGLVEPNDLGEIAYVRLNADELPGVYADVLSATFEANPNYEVTVVPGTFTIAAAPAEPAAPPTPTLTETPTPPTTPAPAGPATPPGTVPDGPLAPILAPVVEALEDAVAPLAGPQEETLADNENPLAGFDTVRCWVHYYLILGIIVTLIYGAGVLVRRINFTRKLKSFEDDVLGVADDPADAPVEAPLAAEGKEA